MRKFTIQLFYSVFPSYEVHLVKSNYLE